jgi:dTDP-glucose 4,6-dehydratase
MKLLVTGGAGFIGSNFIRYMLDKYSDCLIVNLDKLTYAGNLDNLRDIETGPGRQRYSFIRGDITDAQCVGGILDAGVDAIVNFAAESHVDRSIDSARIFLETNIIGTQVLLDAALRKKVGRYVQISTDEVYGSLGPTGFFTEATPIAPNSPYSASKAGADLLVHAYHETFGMPVLITRCSNNYGPYQFPEKLLPLFITNALAGKPLPLYGDGLNVRDWIYVEDHCSGIDLVLRKGKVGDVYNIGGNCEKTNIDITRTILSALNKPDDLIQYVKDRPGHDRRYAIDCSKISSELGWTQKYDFTRGIQKTIEWYLKNEPWWQSIKTGAYLEFYERWYADRR